MPRTYSDAKQRANTRYNNNTYELIGARARKSERLNEQLQTGADRAGISKAAYILDTLRDRLQRDGISAADLPPLPPDQTDE